MIKVGWKDKSAIGKDATGTTTNLRGLSSKVECKNLRELCKEWFEAGVRGEESQVCISIEVPESGGRVEGNRIHIAESPVFPVSNDFGPCYQLELVHCVFLKFTVNLGNHGFSLSVIKV